MNYLIFDTDIYYENESGACSILSGNEANTLFPDLDKECRVIVIDTLQKKIVAPEKIPAKRDDAIASSFSGDYVIQSERITQNLFQVTAIEKSKLTEIYKRLGFDNVKLVIPYGVALREFLKSNDLLGKDRRVVFLDYMGNQVLLTIFNNEAFTTPRRLSVYTKRVVSEITRSQENYKALNKEEKDAKFLIVTNSKEILEEIKKSGLEEEGNIAYFPEKYPALKGLRQGKFSMHYMLPEEFVRLRKLKNFKRKMAGLGMVALVSAVTLILFTGSFFINRSASSRIKDLRLEKASLEEVLKNACQAKYKDILKSKKKIDIPYFVSSFIGALNPEYRVESIRVTEIPGYSYTFEAIISYEKEDKPVKGLKLPRLFKKARMENILIKDRPAIRVVMDIF